MKAIRITSPFLALLMFHVVSLEFKCSADAVNIKPKLLNTEYWNKLGLQPLQHLETMSVIPDTETHLGGSSSTTTGSSRNSGTQKESLTNNINTSAIKNESININSSIPTITSSSSKTNMLVLGNTPAPTPTDKGTGVSKVVSPNGNHLTEYTCKHNDSITQQACLEYCTSHQINGIFDDGKCSKDEKVCECRNTKDGNSKRVKLYRPTTTTLSSNPTSNVKGNSKSQTQSQNFRRRDQQQSTQLVLNAKGVFPCDHTPEAKSICQVYCTMRGSSHSSCSRDHKSCLCFKPESRNQVIPSKKITITSPTYKMSQSNNAKGKGTKNSNDPKRRRGNGRSLFSPEDEHVIGMGLAKQFPFWPFSRPSPPHHLAVCTPYSCVDNCPRGCDNLCTQNLQCFCSCPEDAAYYDYVEDGPIPPFSFYR